MHKMDWVYICAKYTIVIEFTLIVAIIFITYVLKVFYARGARLRKKLSHEIEEYFLDLIHHDKMHTSWLFKKTWRKIDILIPVLNTLNAHYNTKAWKKIEKQFASTTLLPLARTAALSRNWTLRFFAASAFSILSEKTDERFILKLVHDAVPLVFYTSLQSAVANRFERCINTLVIRMSHENWLTKSLLVHAFVKAPLTTRFMIERQLMGSHDPKIRLTCYSILSAYPVGKLRWDMKEDLHSKDTNLKVSAIKYIAHINREVAIPILIDLLNDEQWEVRTVTVHLLSNLQANQAILYVAKCLTDHNWWVRLAAGLYLKKLGKQGKAILESQDIKIHPDAYRVARHVLTRL